MLFMVHWCIQHLDIKAAKEKREKCLIWSEGLDRAFNPWSVERTLVTQGMSKVDWFQKSKQKFPQPSLSGTENLKRSFIVTFFFVILTKVVQFFTHWNKKKIELIQNNFQKNHIQKTLTKIKKSTFFYLSVFFSICKKLPNFC